jgi:hypothetical protein
MFIVVNFKPPSIDTTKPASIEIQKSADNTKVLAEYPSAQVCASYQYSFNGSDRCIISLERPIYF